MEAIHLMRRLIEAHRDRRENLHMVFIDLEKAYDKVSRELIWSCLETKGVAETYISIIKDIYADSLTSVFTPGRDTYYFRV